MDISGPIHDKILCYGMLEAAKDVIQDTHKTATFTSQNGIPDLSQYTNGRQP